MTAERQRQPDGYNPLILSVSPGSRIGPYEIVGAIGAGGMGEVYRAHDTRLHRDVAIKVLPEAFASDPDRLARFEREAQALASLNHPHIAQIHGLETAGGVQALVMELVEGEDLAHRMSRGALPFDEVLRIGWQIADALDAAHERGIIHRDLKPGNIRVTPDGTVKVLDFGLAKIGPAVEQGATTRIQPATEAGVVLGTAAYMAPEQARAQAIDKRADIWSFGVVLYEMLTGERPFSGPTQSDTLVSVLTRDPDWTRVPLGARRLLRQCLERDPKKRLRDIGDARFLIDEARTERAWRVRRTVIPWTIAAVASALAIAVVVLRPSPASSPLIRFDVDLGDNAWSDSLSGVAISPDGRRVVFPIRGADGRRMLATRRLDESRVTPLAGSDGADQVFFSPDGQWVGFVADEQLKKMPIAGGQPVVLAAGRVARGATWGPGVIVAALTNTVGLSRVPEAGGTAQPLTTLEGNELTHRWPQLLPGGRAVLFTGHATNLNDYNNATIDVQSLDTNVRKTVWSGGYFGRYLATSPSRGHLVYVHDGTLFGVPFDPVRLEVAGTPAPLVDDIAVDPTSGAGRFDVSLSGILIYVGGRPMPSWRVSWLDGKGNEQPLLATPAAYYSPRFSPEGDRLAISMDGGKGSDLFVYELKRDTMSRLTFTGENNTDAVWAPDGKHLVFRSLSGEKWRLWWVRTDGAGEPQRLLDRQLPVGDLGASSFSPDGHVFVFCGEDRVTGFDIWKTTLDLTNPDRPVASVPEPLLKTPANEIRPAISPDGRWLAYTSNESGRNQVYVRPFTGGSIGSSGKWQISTAGGSGPVWSRKSNQIFFLSDGVIMVAEYAIEGESFTRSNPRVWSSRQLLNTGYTNLDLAPDGSRFAAFLRPTGGGRPNESSRLTVLLNFFDELRRRVP